MCGVFGSGVCVFECGVQGLYGLKGDWGGACVRTSVTLVNEINLERLLRVKVIKS